jgi:hypothetical protein
MLPSIHHICSRSKVVVSTATTGTEYRAGANGTKSMDTCQCWSAQFKQQALGHMQSNGYSTPPAWLTAPESSVNAPGGVGTISSLPHIICAERALAPPSILSTVSVRAPAFPHTCDAVRRGKRSSKAKHRNAGAH